MFRRDLIDILKARPVSLHELALLLDARPRDLEEDLRHLFRSLRHDPLCPTITPARCRKCGFLFDEHKLRKPGKCPRCGGTWISEPLISLDERSQGNRKRARVSRRRERPQDPARPSAAPSSRAPSRRR